MALQPAAEAFTVMVPVVVEVTLDDVNPLMLPVPLALTKPVPVLLLVQEAVVDGVTVNAGTETAVLPQAAMFDIDEITGVGLIVTVKGTGVALHPPNEALTVTVPVVVEATDGAV